MMIINYNNELSANRRRTEKIEEETREIIESMKQLVIQMKLIHITFEGILKPKQRKEITPLEIKFPKKINPNSEEEKYIKTQQERLLKAEEELLLKSKEEQRRLKGKDHEESE